MRPRRRGHDQLKIFEVAPESVSQTVKIETAAADWSPIRLDADPALRPSRLSQTQEIPLKTASLEDRLMAGIFDLALVIAAFAIFILVFVACTAHPPPVKPALLAAGLVLAGFCLLYQYLFFKFAEGTPGMRYAKIALCTFEDENPSRKAMCRRVLFLFFPLLRWGWGLPGPGSTRIAWDGMTGCRAFTSGAIPKAVSQGLWPDKDRPVVRVWPFPEPTGRQRQPNPI